MNNRDRQLAHFYDLEYRNYTDDLDFYVQYALALDPERRVPVLELGCGTGRVCLALAEAGFSTVGVDRSGAMLDVAREHVEAARLQEKVTLVGADIRDLSAVPPGPYNMVFCALNTFAYLTTSADQLATLRAIYPLLVQHGVLILDLTPPFPEMLAPDNGEVIYQGAFPDTQEGTILHKVVSGRADYATQIHHVTIFYDQEGADGTLFRLTQQVDFRWTGRYEIVLLLDASGYEVDQILGGYELQEFDESSERMIFVARRKG